jgi:hypothetical protein
MKKLIALSLSLFFFFGVAVGISPAQAADPVPVILMERPHMGLDGTFYDDQLATLLLPSQRLGQLVFTPSRVNKVWYIDAALLDQVAAMADGYSVRVAGKSDELVAGTGMNVATSWLSALKQVTRINPVLALPYGSPATNWLERVALNELKFYVANSQLKVGFYVGKYVDVARNFPGEKAPKIPGETQDTYNFIRKNLRGYLKVIDIQDTDPYRLGIAQLANPALSRDDSIRLSRAFLRDFQSLNKRLRIVVGKYTITSEREKIPMTIVNGFNKDVTVSVVVSPLNGKVTVSPIRDVTIPAQSKLIVPIHLHVIASGNSTLLVQLKSSDKTPVGNSVSLPLRLSVISPIATWITTISAIVLLLAGVTQSVRRVKKKKHE